MNCTRTGRPFRSLINVRERVAAAFARLPAWQDWDAPWPESFDAAIAEGLPEFAPSIAWAHRQTISSKASSIACISHPIRRVSGKADVIVASEVAPVWFVSASRDSENFFRWLIIETTVNPDELAALAPFAFQGLDFVEGSFNGIKAMSKPYRTLVPTVVKHLAALSDDGARIFSDDWARVSAEFGSLGIDISDENGETKGNRVARIERTRTVNGEPRIFWWHTKLERHQDRIHLCPLKVRDGGRILVGIFCHHLST